MSNWQTKQLDDLMTFIPTGSHSRDNMTVASGDRNDWVYNIHYGDIHTKYLTYVDLKQVNIPVLKEDDYRSVMLLKDRDLVMADASEDYEGVGAAVELRNVDSKKVIGGLHTYVMRNETDELAAGFAGLLLQNPDVRKTLMQIAVYSKVFGITKSSLSKVKVLYPDIPEQQRIVEVLKVWDEYLEALDKKIALKEQLKKGLMQQLLTGKKRLPGFSGGRNTMSFSDILNIISKKPGYKSSEYSLNGDFPIYDQSYNRHVGGYTDETEKLITSEDGTILFGDHSRVVKYIKDDKFAVGNDGIKLFSAKQGIDSHYAYLLLSLHPIPNTGYNRHFKYMAEAVFHIPHQTEQQAVSALIQTICNEIDGFKMKSENIKLQKKYLLKNLTSGTIRTPENLQVKGIN